MDGTVALDQLGFGVVRLAGNAVGALVGAELDVTVVADRREHLGHRPVVTGLGGANEVVVGDVELPPRLLEPLAGAVGHRARVEPEGLGRLLHLQPVLVRAGEVEDVVAEEPVPPRDGVADQGRVGVTDVRRVVDVVDGRRDVETRHGS